MVKKKIKKFLKTDLFKVSFWNGIATVLKLATGIVTSKIIAIYLGPSAIALLGQFRSFTTMVMNFSTLGINTGVTKYIAQLKEDKKERNRILSTGFYITMMGTFIASLIVLFGREYFEQKILLTDKYTSVFIIFGATLFLFTLNNFFVGVFNGFKQFKVIIIRNIFGSLLSLGIAVILVIKFGLYGALLGIIISQTLIFFFLLGVIMRAPWFSFKEMFSNFHTNKVWKFSHFALMSIVSTISVTFVQFSVRDHIMTNLSTQDAGYWEAILRISRIFLQVFTTTLSLYYLPRLSEIKSNGELRKEIFKGFKFIVPLLVFGGGTVFMLRRLVVDILYTSEFYPMLPLFKYQLAGDILKITSWLLAYNLLAKAKTLFYISTEIIFGLSFYFLTIFFVGKYGVEGPTYAYAINNLAYLIVMLFMFFKIFKVKNEN